MEITIFDIPEKEITTNKTQKELEYEILIKNSRFASFHFYNFLDMDNDELQKSADSNILSITCMQVAEWCIPITDRKSKYSISVQFNKNILVYDVGIGKIMIPSGSHVQISGFYLPSILHKYYDTSIMTAELINTKILLNCGKFGITEPISSQYIQTRKELTNIKQSVNSVIFKDEKHAKHVIEKTNKLIQYLKSTYNTGLPLILTDAKFKPFEQEKFDNPADLKWEFNSKLTSSDTADHKEIKKILDDISVDPKGISDIAIYDLLYLDNAIRLFNIGRYLGIKHKMYAEELELFNRNIKVKSTEELQFAISYGKKLEDARKSMISYHKFGILDISKLTGKQTDIINLEYKKLLQKNTNTELFDSLQHTFDELNVSNCKKYLTQIEKKYGKLLDKDELLDGACPHIYHYGVIYIKNFNKPWLGTELRNFMIHQFGIEDTSGFYCKICGEHIADPDTVSIKFSSNYTEDLLQTAIWKEAMYIISSYIRFSIPCPLKPFVSSVASGIYGKLSEEEAKLLKSKTSTGISIKDTMSVYTSIYVFAVCSALIIENPTKIMFGKESNGKKREINKKFSKQDKHSEYMENITVDKADDENDKVDKNSKDNNNVDDHNANDNVENIDNTENTKNETDEEPISTINTKKFKKSTKTKTKLPTNKSQKKNNKKIKGGMLYFSGSRRKYLGGKSTKNIKNYEAQVMTTALKLIFLTKNAVINKIQINSDIIKTMFLSVYKWAKQYSKPIKITDNKQLDDTLQQEQFYEYLTVMKKISNYQNKDKKNKEFVETTFSILGKKYSDDTKDKSPYNQITSPTIWTYNEPYSRYQYLSFMQMFEYVKDELFLEKCVPRHPKLLQNIEKYEEIKKLEDEVYFNISKKHIRPFLSIKMNKILYPTYDITQFYCPNGENHKVGSFLYEGKGIKLEYTNSEIIDMIGNSSRVDIKKINKFYTTQLYNERCEKCKKLIRTLEKSNKKDIFKKLNDINAFYQYFEIRCPKGDLHEFQNAVCVKCKFNNELKKTNNADYYQKYIDRYKQIENKKYQLSNEYLKKIKDFTLESKKYTTERKSTYKYTLQQTAQWSKITDVKYNLLLNIGLMEGLDMLDIEKGKLNPYKTFQENSTIFETQAIKLRGYIVKTLRTYNKLINNNLDNKLKTFMDKHKKTFNMHDIPKIEFNFITDDILFLDGYYQANFLMEYLASVICKIHDKKTEKNKSTVDRLIKYLTDDIMQDEKLTSKAIPIFKNMEDITLDDSGISSADDTDISIGETNTEDSQEENQIDMNLEDAYDVENAEAIWENE